MPVEQIKSGLSNFSYVIRCPETKRAAIVDPGYDGGKALSFVEKHDLKLDYVINTHHHPDHSADTGRIAGESGAKVITGGADSDKVSSDVDLAVGDGDEVRLGELKLTFISTPGHTPGGICILVDDEALITGDTLFIGDCGRCDMAGGSTVDMFNSLNDKIMKLSDHLIVNPGHDYGDRPRDTLGRQKRTNKTLLAKDLAQFSKIP